MTLHQLFFEQVEPGMTLPPLVKRPTAIQIFRFSAATWNAHQIHYNAAYAREQEGYPDILVQAHLHGCYLAEMVQAWIGGRGRLAKFGWQNRRAAVPGDELTCTGVVTRTYVERGSGFVECALEERNQHSELCAPGQALVSLPRLGEDGAREQPTR